MGEARCVGAFVDPVRLLPLVSNLSQRSGSNPHYLSRKDPDVSILINNKKNDTRMDSSGAAFMPSIAQNAKPQNEVDIVV